MEANDRFIGYLEGLRDNRGALANLRRGLGEPPGTVASMYRYIVPWISADTPSWREEAYYLVSALFAYHPDPGGEGSMGKHFANARDPQTENVAIERRFTALLSAHPDDLGTYLRQAVSFLKSKEVPIDWRQLLRDVMAWGHSERYVQQRWARDFWSSAEPPNDD